MFGKKFFGTVALSGSAVSLVGNAESFTERHFSDIVLTCKDSHVDGLEKYLSTFSSDAHGSLVLQQLVNCFHLDRSETEQILYRMGDNPHNVYFLQPLSLGQVSVFGNDLGMVLLKKRGKSGFFCEQDYIVMLFPKQVEEMLQTNLDLIKF